MTQQYLRAVSLVVGTAGGSGLDLSALRVEFTVTHPSVQTPKLLVARVSNVAKSTAATVHAEFTRVSLSAGYQGAIGLLFQGAIRQTKYGRSSPTDTYLDIIAADGDKAYSTGFVNQVLAAGWTAADVFREIVTAGAPLGLTAGTPPPVTVRGIRPKVLFGPIRDICRNLAASTGTSWSITDGALNFTPLQVAAVPSQQAIVLSPSTGLIGIPHQTIDGVEATCLLNPQIKAGSYVTIDKSLIAAAQVDVSYSAMQGGNLSPDGKSVIGVSPTGTYYVDYVEHFGDTRGGPWYSVISCHAADANAVQGNAKLTAVP